MPEPLIVCDNLVKIYKVADLEVVALQGLDLEITPGEMIALVGASGSGKSTLMNILGGLDMPSAGRCSVAGNDLTRLSETQRILLLAEYAELLRPRERGKRQSPRYPVCGGQRSARMSSAAPMFMSSCSH